MSKILCILSLALLTSCALTGKSEPVVRIEYRNQVITIPENLFVCPQIGKLPNPETLTNAQVNSTIAKLVKYNKVCGISMESIKEYQRKAKAAVDSSN